ncbi:FAD-dependent oxidoreductase [Rossellomorea marisflavi]|jgi:glycine/D-amino acid oxidase-like deaminating enzyme/nitrite reductase/ring-hydroxylating ferredoxin subunit|uniref:FAD-dependent oxidoreductase n=1 Tax=Rossellomorea marisflavi TaxID=189381 RepID=UPI0028536373|nr:FAD-dependent oxidoreductase [Rossellomorea marisflavi]MDR4935089.1 FAD-dependent oxidoreductase [Rossellomorea marisflavi]
MNFQHPEPYWRKDTHLQSYPKLDRNLRVDAVVVGSGIAGITTAYFLAKGGKKVALIEADRVLNGTTGHTTAKITAQHGLIYDELMQHFGTEYARHYYESNMKALNWIKETGKGLDCDLREQDAYVYAETNEYLQKVQKEYDAYLELGIDGELVETIPLDIPIKQAIMMKGQAEFHPLKFFKHLLESFIGLGGQVFEQTPAETIEDDTTTKVMTANGYHLECEKIAICTHFPFFDGMGLYFTKMYAERSYIIGIKSEKKFPGGMYINAEDPSRSFRSVVQEGGELILIGGENHKAGQGKDTREHYEALEKCGQSVFGDTENLHRWSAQDLISVDKVPYIGTLSPKHPTIFVATGFKKWGMTTGTLSGMILSDLILGNHNIYADLYAPSRFVADPSIKHFISQNADVAKHLVKGKLQIPFKSSGDLKSGEGGVVWHEGKKCGGYRDTDGKLHLVDNTCTHLGCETAWNQGDLTWDCPCHGSRFSPEGTVIEGPAQKPLPSIDE